MSVCFQPDISGIKSPPTPQSFQFDYNTKAFFTLQKPKAVFYLGSFVEITDAHIHSMLIINNCTIVANSHSDISGFMLMMI